MRPVFTPVPNVRFLACNPTLDSRPSAPAILTLGRKHEGGRATSAILMSLTQLAVSNYIGNPEGLSEDSLLESRALPLLQAFARRS